MTVQRLFRGMLVHYCFVSWSHNEFQYTLTVIHVPSNLQFYRALNVNSLSTTDQQLSTDLSLHAKMLAFFYFVNSKCLVTVQAYFCQINPTCIIHHRFLSLCFCASFCLSGSFSQKPGMDLADTYITFVRQNQDILRDRVNDEMYTEKIFDVSASADTYTRSGISSGRKQG